MSFVAMDKFGRAVDADPKDPENIYDIRSVDITLTFRSASKSGFLKILGREQKDKFYHWEEKLQNLLVKMLLSKEIQFFNSAYKKLGWNRND